MGRPKIDDVMSCATTGSAPPAYLIDGLYVRYLHSFFLSLSLSFLVFSPALVKATRMAQPSSWKTENTGHHLLPETACQQGFKR